MDWEIANTRDILFLDCRTQRWPFPIIKRSLCHRIPVISLLIFNWHRTETNMSWTPTTTAENSITPEKLNSIWMQDPLQLKILSCRYCHALCIWLAAADPSIFAASVQAPWIRNGVNTAADVLHFLVGCCDHSRGGLTRKGSRKETWRTKQTEERSFETTCSPTIIFGYLLILLIGWHVVQNHLHVKTPQ